MPMERSRPSRDSKGIRFIVRAFFLVFVMFPYPDKENKFSRGATKFFDAFAIAMLCYFLSSDMASIIRLWPKVSPSIIIGTVITGLTAISIRVILIRKRKSIIKALCMIQDLKAALGAQQDESRQLCKYGFYLLIASVVPIIYIVNLVENLQHAERVVSYQKTFFYGWHTDGHYWWPVLVIFVVDLLQHQQQYFMQGLCLILCCYAFQSMSLGIRGLSQRLSDRSCSTLKGAAGYLASQFEEVYRCVEEMENALSLLLTLLYGFLIWTMFTIINYLSRYTFTPAFRLTLANDLLLLAIDIPSFLVISYRASSVHESAVQLRNAVFRTVAELSRTGDEDGNVLVKMAADFSSRVAVTGSKFFVMRKEIVLNIIGVVVTYGILLLQLGR